RSALVVCQVTLAFVLLIGAGLLSLSFARLLSVNPGFVPQNVQTAEFSLPRSRYPDDARLRAFVSNLMPGLRAIPGVIAAGAINGLPMSGDSNGGAVMIEGYPLAAGELPPVPSWATVDEGYFQALGVALREGRVFTQADTAEAPRAVVIDEYLARKYWPKGSAIGGRIRTGVNATAQPWTAIGVVALAQPPALADRPRWGQIYFSYRQSAARQMYVVVRTRDSGPVVAAVRDALRKADPELSLFDVKSMPERVAASLRDRKAAMV